MIPTDFKVYSSLANQLNFHNVSFSKIKSIKYNKYNLFSLQYNCNFQTSSLRKQARKGVIATSETIFEKEFNTCTKITINPDKKNDIESLYVFLPENHVRFFSDLLM